MLITDGRTGNTMAVSNENRGKVESVSSSIEHHINHHDQVAFNVKFAQSPTANDDCIFYMVNTDSKDLIVEGVWLAVSGACEVSFKINDKGTRNSATALTPVNMNGESGKLADGTFEQGADLDGGAATLTGGNEFATFVFYAAADSNNFNFGQDLILPKNSTMTMWCNDSTVTVNSVIEFNYHDLG